VRRGITLLEMLVAAIILAVGLVSALTVIGQCATATAAARDHARAMLFARSKMDEILKEPVLQTGTDQGRGVDTTTDYDWQANIDPSPNPSLVVVTVVATSRSTTTSVAITALRRPDLVTPPSTNSTTGATTTPTPAATRAPAPGAT
jgi:type II secretion system protein I